LHVNDGRIISVEEPVTSMKFAALDGSLHNVKTDEGDISYVVVAVIYGNLWDGGFKVTGMKTVDGTFRGSGEEEMRRMEYFQAAQEQVDLILMDRMLSMDVELGLPENVVAIVKDFPGRDKLNQNVEVPWLILEEGRVPQRGYFKLRRTSWIFMTEWTKGLAPGQVLRILRQMSGEPIPEALGYNYPLFLADKLAKLRRDRFKRTMDFLLTRGRVRYRDFRRIVESARALGGSRW
jgi:NurA domain.